MHLQRARARVCGTHSVACVSALIGRWVSTGGARCAALAPPPSSQDAPLCRELAEAPLALWCAGDVGIAVTLVPRSEAVSEFMAAETGRGKGA